MSSSFLSFFTQYHNFCLFGYFIVTYIYSIRTNLSAVTTGLFCITIINHGAFSCCMLTVQEYDAEDDRHNVTQMWSVLKVAPLESNPGLSLGRRTPKFTVTVGKMMGMAGCAAGHGHTFKCQPGKSDPRVASLVCRSPLFPKE